MPIFKKHGSFYILSLLFCLACFLFNASLAYSQGKYSKSRLINPLLRYIKFKELVPFDNKINLLVEKQKEYGMAKEISVYFRSLSDGIWFGIDETEQFSPGSLLKIPIMFAYLKSAQDSPDILQNKLKYVIDENALDQNMLSAHPAVENKYYTTDDFIALMISKSDNSATRILATNINNQLLDQVFSDMGLNFSGINIYDDFLLLRDYTRMFRVLYNASYLNEEMSEKALGYLVNTEYKDGLVAGVPPDIIVAHKFGERYFLKAGVKQLHDVGIIYHSRNPYLLGVMTKGDDFGKLATVIKEISQAIYEEVDRQYANTPGADKR